MLSINGVPWLVICVFLLWMCGFYLVTCYKIKHISVKRDGHKVNMLQVNHIFVLCVSRLSCSHLDFVIEQTTGFNSINIRPLVNWAAIFVAVAYLNNSYVPSLVILTLTSTDLTLNMELLCVAHFHFSFLQQHAVLSLSVHLLYLNYTVLCSSTPSQIPGLFHTVPCGARTVATGLSSVS